MNIPSVTRLKTRVASPGCYIMAELCLANAQKGEMGTKARRVLLRGATLYRCGETLDAVYILYSGSAKSFVVSEHGEQQITEFYMPGDIMGLDGFDCDLYASNVELLETSSVCRIDLGQLHKALGDSTELRQHFLKAMSHSLKGEHAMLFNMCNLSAEQRLADFLLGLSHRFEARGFSGREFNLSMSRGDIANYLGMKIETVSRVFTKLHRRGLIDVNRRQIRIVDTAKLRDSLEAETGGNITIDSTHRGHFACDDVRLSA